MSRTPGRGANRYRVAVVVVLSLVVVGYAVITYGPLDPAASRVGLRPGLGWHFPLLLTHIFAGAVALTLGPLQLVRRLRRRRLVHRYLGRAYLFAGVFPASVAGIGVALLSTAGPVAAAGLAVGDVLWFATAVLGYQAARAQHYRDHERWMLRNLALTFAAVTFRGWLGLFIAVQLPWLGPLYGGDFGRLFHTAYSITTWFAFIPNVAVVSFYLRARSAGGSSRRDPAASNSQPSVPSPLSDRAGGAPLPRPPRSPQSPTSREQ